VRLRLPPELVFIELRFIELLFIDSLISCFTPFKDVYALFNKFFALALTRSDLLYDELALALLLTSFLLNAFDSALNALISSASARLAFLIASPSICL